VFFSIERPKAKALGYLDAKASMADPYGMTNKRTVNCNDNRQATTKATTTAKATADP
jgi:hypothetical protein